MKIILLTVVFLLTSSCANFIKKIHRDLDRGSKKSSKHYKKKKRGRDSFARFRNPYYSTKRNALPKIQRNYRPSSKVKKRYTTDDLTDNQSDGSLWSGRGNNNYLFSLDQEKKNGDIIVINVYDKLKREIRMELKRSVPRVPIKTKKSVTNNADSKKAPAAPTESKEKKPTTNVDEAFDKISSVIVEKINKDHFLIRGQKQILFKNKKRIVEIQALVAKRDIEENDTIHSDNLLESNINLVR